MSLPQSRFSARGTVLVLAALVLGVPAAYRVVVILRHQAEVSFARRDPEAALVAY